MVAVLFASDSRLDPGSRVRKVVPDQSSPWLSCFIATPEVYEAPAGAEEVVEVAAPS